MQQMQQINCCSDSKTSRAADPSYLTKYVHLVLEIIKYYAIINLSSSSSNGAHRTIVAERGVLLVRVVYSTGY